MAEPGFAVIETYEFSDPALEARYHGLSQELRCPKCQNQNIADSNAPISQDLRRLVYEQLEAGSSDEEILDDMVRRYGEFVRYRPSSDGVTLWLWVLPLLLLIIGFGVMISVLRGGRAVPAAAEAVDEGKLEALLRSESSEANRE
ncbi:MAG: cytochrome c-type biogenesis protein [Pseudomonadota bacterium]